MELEMQRNTTPPSARCRRTPFDEVECTIPSFHAGLIAAWKREVPYRHRAFDPDSKAWRFWGGYEELALARLLGFFPDAEIPHSGRSRGATPSRPAGSDHFRIPHLRETAPVELIE